MPETTQQPGPDVDALNPAELAVLAARMLHALADRSATPAIAGLARALDGVLDGVSVVAAGGRTPGAARPSTRRRTTAMTRTMTFHGISEPTPGPRWRALFEATWPAYRAWYLSDGDEPRPT